MNKIKYVVFDFDGTIADTLPLIKQYADELGKRYSKIINVKEVQNKGIDVFIKEILESGFPKWKIPLVIHEMKKRMKEKMRKDVKPFPGMFDILKKLKEKYSLGIVSSNSKENIEGFLKKYKMDKFFSFIHSDSSLFGKHLVLKKMCEKYNLLTDEVIYVGDENRDILAAKKIKIRIISVSWGFNSEKLLKSLNPNYFVKKPEQILKIL